MKRILVIFLASLFSFGLIAQNAMAVSPKGEEMVTNVFSGSEPVTPAPLTAKEVKDINRDLLKEKDKKTANALQELTGKDGAIEKLGGKIDGLDSKVGAIDNVSKDLNKTSAAINRSTLILVGLMCAGFLILALLVLRNGKSIHNLGTTVDLAEKKVDEVPARTAKLVKQLEPITITVRVAGRNITYIPEIVDNMYRSLYVPIAADDNANASEIPRARKVDPGAIHNSTRDVMKLYFNEKCSSLQKRVIEHLKETSALKIEKIAA